MTSSLRLSVPPTRRSLPREPTSVEMEGLRRIADALIPASGEVPAAGQMPGMDEWLTRALQARRDVFEAVMALAAELGAAPREEVQGTLRELDASAPPIFALVSRVVAGAYLMIPSVREMIGYPGQERHFAPFDQAADEISSGILDAVTSRGHLIRATAGRGWEPASGTE
jgi:hypothetical protein